MAWTIKARRRQEMLRVRAETVDVWMHDTLPRHCKQLDTSNTKCALHTLDRGARQKSSQVNASVITAARAALDWAFQQWEVQRMTRQRPTNALAFA